MDRSQLRRPLVAGNWKMHGLGQEAVELGTSIMREVSGIDDVEVLICPPFTALTEIVAAVRDSKIIVGSQNCHWSERGAFTGEVSVPMLKAVGCRYVIVGHSERRHVFGEDDEIVAAKVAACRDGGLITILCVGETLEQREADRTSEIVSTQLSGALTLGNLTPENLVIAYEPVWAIGTGRTATPQQAQSVHAGIRQQLGDSLGGDAAAAIRILYGGSVNAENADALFAMEDIDGGLIGGASLAIDSFVPIVRAASASR
ncbi:MAG: triose-phosphate isomerase [Acidobacteriota bacterium]|nr:triose-phosphate isomerase [Acidobacteriota bacterium]MDH3786041.1 triose-phosphate isomerase [Acidobacteriota bacterium]